MTNLDNPSPRAAIYARVSTADQVHGLSLEVQRTRAVGHAAAHGWTVVGTYVDEGVSGAKQHRPELDRLIAAVRRGELDVVIVHKLDRLGRTMRTLAALLAECDDHSTRVVSVSEAFDSLTANGRLMRNLLGSFAEFERERIRSRALDGIEATVRAGGWPGGTAPFGWRLVRDPGSAHGRLELDPAEHATLRRAVHLFVDEQRSPVAIARELNDHGCLPRGSTSRPDVRTWTAGSLRACLRRCDHFAGTWTYRRNRPGRATFTDPAVTIAIPPAFSDRELAALRARLQNTSTTFPRAYQQPAHLLTSRLFSPHDAPMHGLRRGAKPRIYLCAHTNSTNPRPRCSCRSINADVLEALVWTELHSLLTDQARLHALAETAIDTAQAAETAATESARTLARRVNDLEHALGKQLAQFLADGYDSSAVAHATSTLRQQLDAAKQRHQQALHWEAANRAALDRRQQVWELAARAAQRLNDPDPATRRRIVDLLDIRVDVDEWDTCPTCTGKGKIPDPRRLPPTGRKRLPQDRMQAPNCPTCHGHKTMPRLTVTGIIPTPTATPADSSLPFQLRAVAT